MTIHLKMKNKFRKIEHNWYFITNSVPKENDLFIEEGSRTSYHNKIYKCTGGTYEHGGGFVFSKDINHPFPENCKKIIKLW